METGITLAHPALTGILADSINPKKRGIALTTRTLTINLPNSFAPILGGS